MKKIYFLGILAVLIGAVSCKKDASTFQGQVRYVDSTGAYFSADSAVLTLHDNDTAQPALMTTLADAEGIYMLTDVPDGKYVVKGVLTIDSTLSYIGVTQKLTCAGKDFIAAPVDMW